MRALAIFIFLLSAHLGWAQLSDVDQATIKSYLEQAKEHESKSEKAVSAGLYSKVAYIYWNNEKNAEAHTYFLKAIEQNLEIGNTNALRTLYTNIAMIYSEKSDYSSALDYFKKSLQINRQLGRKSDAASNLLNIGVTLNSLSKHNDAVINLETALELALETGDMRLIKNCYNLLAESYQALGKTEKAYEYFDKYSSIEKMLKQKEIENIELMKQKAESEKRETEIAKSQTESTLKSTEESLKQVEKVSHEKQTQIELLVKEKKLKELMLKEQQARLRMARVLTFYSIGALALMGVVIVLVYWSYRQKKKSNEKLAAQNHEIMKQQEIIAKKNSNIMNSLNYAKRIQKAILPPQQNIKELLPESFIFFRPRDIVSGDFFFFTNIEGSGHTANSILMHDLDKKVLGKTDKVIVSAIDCTGHGVPGAFMSLIGHNLLIEIIAQGITSPGEILKNMHTGIKTILNQGNTENRDGMDMALCYYDKNTKELHYAGAKNPLIYIQHGVLNQIKADILPIGGLETSKERTFTNHVIKINEPTMVYVYSDGFQDQIGGTDGRKYLSKNFKELLVNIHQKPVDEQKELLDQELSQWMGRTYTQVDDILIIGFRVG